MTLEKLLTERKSAILNRWFDLSIASYPEETAQFLKNKKNRFANPVGYILSQEMEPILNGLFNGADLEKMQPFLENIIRIRAVQDFSPSRAMAFIFSLKQVIREEMDQEIRENRIGEGLLEIESRIDLLGLLAFDIFMKCREKIYDLKAHELRNQTVRLLKKANLIAEETADGSPPIT